MASMLFFLTVLAYGRLEPVLTSRPHIIVIVADDLGYNDVSFHGSNQIPTPNIDALADSGVILDNYYVSPICTPTRSALMTGRHPIHTGMQRGVIDGNEPYGLPLGETIMPQYLNHLGYHSHIIGKWHLGMFAKQYTPVYRGFKSHFGFYQGCGDYYGHSYEASQAMWGYDFRRDMTVTYNYSGLYSTQLFNQEAVNVIDSHNASEPLFLYLPYQAVHSANKDSYPSPLQAPQAYIDKFSHIFNYKRRVYAAMVSVLDDGVGMVHHALKRNKMMDNSIIVFTTDNGGPANGYDYNAASNFPLRGLKNTLWEGGIRGVGFVNSPLLEKQGYVSKKMLHVCDWLPTLYEAAGGDVISLKSIDGVSAWKMLSSDGPTVRTEILHNIDPIGHFAALRVGDFKLVTGDIGVAFGHWYPPWQLAGDDYSLHVNRLSSISSNSLRFRGSTNKEYFLPQVDSSKSPAIHRKLSGAMHAGMPMPVQGSPVTIDCGRKPDDAGENCQPTISPCLFNILKDPCEYYNLAPELTNVVSKMYARLVKYMYSMVPPGNQLPDFRGNPRLHNNTWVPWVIM